MAEKTYTPVAPKESYFEEDPRAKLSSTEEELYKEVLGHFTKEGYVLPGLDNGALTDKDKPDSPAADALAAQPELESPEDAAIRQRRFIRRMRYQMFAGSLLGLLIAVAIGAAFIAVWFTKASDLWAKSEELWEGTVSFVDPDTRRAHRVTPRYLRADRVSHDLRHGCHHAQDGPREG